MSDQPETESRGPGRPSLKTPELCAEIVERLGNGEPLAIICRDDHMPARQKVYEWAAADPAFSGHIARARIDGHDMIAARAMYTARGDAVNGESTGDIQRDKLIIDTDLKLLAKWDSRYRDRSGMELTGADGGPIKSEVALAPDEAYKRMLNGGA